MVDTCRSPNVEKSAVRMSWMFTPSELALSRSMFSCACRPFSCASLVTSRKSASWRMGAMSLSDESCSSPGETLFITYWKRDFDTRPPMRRFWIGLK